MPSSIPKIMRFYWSGCAMSWLRYMSIYSFSKLHPDWDVRLYLLGRHGYDVPKYWESGHQDFQGYHGPDWTLKAIDLPNVTIHHEIPHAGHERCDPVHCRDVWGWRMLARNAGFVSDMDILYVQSIDSLRRWCGDSQHLMCWMNGHLSMGLLASTGGGSMFADVAEIAESITAPSDFQSCGVQAVYSLLSESSEWKAGFNYRQAMSLRYPKLRIANLPASLFYPIDCTDIRALWNLPQALPYGELGLHWYAGAQQSQYVNRIVTPANWQKHYPDSIVLQEADRIASL